MQIVTQKIRAFELFEFPASDLNALLKANGSTSTDVRVKIGEKFDWLMSIEEHDIRSLNYQMIEMTDNGPIEHPKNNQVNTYKGTIDGDNAQWARLYVSDFKLGMSFLVDGILYRIAPLSQYLSGHQFDNSFLLFKQEDVVISNGSCATESDHIPDDIKVSPDDTEDEVRFLQLATDVDYEFYLLFKDVGTGTPIGNVQAKIEQIVNEIDRRYSDAAYLYIRHTTSHIWSTNIDPYSNTDDIEGLWNEFRTEWQGSYKCNPRDAALLFSGRDNSGPIGVVRLYGNKSICGNEYTDCSDYFNWSYGVVAHGNSPNIDATAAHELGHIIGLGHICDECGLMNPGNCDPVPCITGSYQSPNEFSQYSIDRLKLVLGGQERKCIGTVKKYFDRDHCLLTDELLAQDVIIEENTIWTASTVPNGGIFKSLTIDPGYSLTLMPNVSLSFPNDGYIDVDKSTLINYGRLTGCEDQWDGVNVYGNYGLEPISTQGQYIGKRKSIIEKAKIGIETMAEPAVVKVDHAKFFNNQVSIKLSGVFYLDDPISSSLSTSEIKFCEFKVDEPITGGFTSFIDLHKMNMTKYNQLRGNELYLSKEQAQIPNYGITAKSSNIQAGFNKIDGLQYGINVEDGFAYIIGNNIINCKYGAFLRGVNVNNIFINQFHFGNMADAYLGENNKQIGIVLESAISGFTMSRNVFKGALGSPFITTIGTQCTDMGTNDYRISDNHYSELNIANAAHKLNGRTVGGIFDENGLRYLCNHLTLNTSDIYVTTDPTSIIKPGQGWFNDVGQSQPAYNEFSFLWPNAGWDYHNHYPSTTGGLQFVYYYDPDNTNTIPREGRYVNTIIKPADEYGESYCYVKPTIPGPKDPDKGKKYYPTEAEKNSNRNRYFAAKDALQVSSMAKEQAAIQNNESLLEQKSNESQYHLSEVNDAAYKGYLYSIIDSTGSDADSIPIWLERMHTFESEVSRADWHRQRGQEIVANEILNQLPNKFNLTGSYISDLDLYRNLLEINSQELDNAALYQLEAAADSDHRLSSAYAKNVLSQHGFYYPPIDFELPVELQNAVQETSSETQLKVLVTPNPTNAYVRFDWSQFNVGSDVVTIELRDRVGNLLDLLTSSPGQYTKELSLETYQDGVIFYYLKHKEEPMDSGHIILSK